MGNCKSTSGCGHDLHRFGQQVCGGYGNTALQEAQPMPTKVWEREIVDRFDARLGHLHSLAARADSLATRLKGAACNQDGQKDAAATSPNGFNEEMSVGLHFMDSLMERIDAALCRLEA